MSSLIPAMYENGVIRPLHPLSLAEGQPLQVQIIVDESLIELQNIAQSLEATGIITLPPYADDIAPVPAKDWQELSERLKTLPGKTISELVIEERGTW